MVALLQRDLKAILGTVEVVVCAPLGEVDNQFWLVVTDSLSVRRAHTAVSLKYLKYFVGGAETVICAECKQEGTYNTALGDPSVDGDARGCRGAHPDCLGSVTEEL